MAWRGRTQRSGEILRDCSLECEIRFPRNEESDDDIARSRNTGPNSMGMGRSIVSTPT